MTLHQDHLSPVSGVTAQPNGPRWTWLARFARSEEGTILPFAIPLVVAVGAISYIGVDLMRHELFRTKLQATLDRAALAAADTARVQTPRETVDAYLAQADMAATLAPFDAQNVQNGRYVQTSANLALPPGTGNLVPALGTARADTQVSETVGNLEISLVLDISRNMATGTRMQNLRDAADAFINTVLPADGNSQMSLSLVPFSEQVNIGWPLFSQLSTNWVHNYSYCIEMPPAEYSTATLTQAFTYPQAQHFQWDYDGYSNTRTNKVCPRYSYETILPLSNDATALKARVAQLQPRAGVAVFAGVKWGTTLLDSNSSNLVNGLITQGTTPAVFSGRPAQSTDTNTQKSLVVVASGTNTDSYRIAPSLYANQSHYAHWNAYNFWYYVSSYVPVSQRNNWWRFYYPGSTGDQMTRNICDSAKATGIIIWAVSFEGDAATDTLMCNCASSPNHSFAVSGSQLTGALGSIARSITNQRLSQ